MKEKYCQTSKLQYLHLVIVRGNDLCLTSKNYNEQTALSYQNSISPSIPNNILILSTLITSIIENEENSNISINNSVIISSSITNLENNLVISQSVYVNVSNTIESNISNNGANNQNITNTKE